MALFLQSRRQRRATSATRRARTRVPSARTSRSPTRHPARRAATDRPRPPPAPPALPPAVSKIRDATSPGSALERVGETVDGWVITRPRQTLLHDQPGSWTTLSFRSFEFTASFSFYARE